MGINRSARRFGTTSPNVAVSLGPALLVLLRLTALGVVLLAGALLAPGFILDVPQPAPTPSDAIVVISGDEQMARFAEGVNLYEQGFGHYLVFSGAAYDN